MAETIRHDKTARQLRLLSDALDSGRLGPVRRLVNSLSPAEIGNLLESLPPGKRSVVWGLVDAEDDGEVLVHVGEDVRESLIADMDPDEIVAAVEDLDIDDLADLVEDLPDTVIDEVLKSMDRENRERLEQYDAALIPLASERTRAAIASYRGGGGLLASVLEARRMEIDTHMERLRLEMETAAVWAQLEYLIPAEHLATAANRIDAPKEPQR